MFRCFDVRILCRILIYDSLKRRVEEKKHSCHTLERDIGKNVINHAAILSFICTRFALMFSFRSRSWIVSSPGWLVGCNDSCTTSYVYWMSSLKLQSKLASDTHLKNDCVDDLSFPSCFASLSFPRNDTASCVVDAQPKNHHLICWFISKMISNWYHKNGARIHSNNIIIIIQQHLVR